MKTEVSSRRAISSIQRAVRVGLGAAVAAALALPSAAVALPSGSQQPQKYVQAGPDGATLFNLPDPKGHEVLELAADEPLAVYGSYASGRFLKVAAPGGLKVWIFGKYLRESQRVGWIEVTGSYVNMRPLPRSQDSYPLGQLDRGDRLLFIQRKDPSKPLVDDWVQVYSPSGTMAYVLAEKTSSLSPGEDGKALWAAAEATAVSTHETSAGPLPVEAAQGAGTAAAGAGTAAAAGAQPTGSVYAALAAADAEADKQLATKNPDFAAMEAGYVAVLAMGPDAPTKNLIEQRIKTVHARRDLALLRADIALTKAEKEKRLEELNYTIDQASRERDPLWGRFQTRGWLDRGRLNGEVIYLVRWGSEYISQIECSSGRYDLELFKNFEIGVRGIPVRAASEEQGGYPVIDVDRIEVISARYTHNSFN